MAFARQSNHNACRGERVLLSPREDAFKHIRHIADQQLDCSRAGCDEGRPIGSHGREGECAAAMVATLWRLPTARLHLTPAVDTEWHELFSVVAVDLDGVGIHRNTEDLPRAAALPRRRDRDLAGLVGLCDSI